jgi:UPF0271 protein
MIVEINCDMGEGFGIYQVGDDEGLMAHINLANIACGFHASDPIVMTKTVAMAKKQGVKIGAHPSLPDLQGFGRREMKMKPDELVAAIIYQVGALKGFVEAEGLRLNHIKPHGSLYGMSARSEEVANAICDAAEKFEVSLFGMSGTMHEKVYCARGIPFLAEFYADLDYDQEGNLIITREHKAVDPDQAAARVVRALREGKVESVQGIDVPVRVDTVCIHSDTPGAVAVVNAVRRALQSYHSADAEVSLKGRS